MKFLAVLDKNITFFAYSSHQDVRNTIMLSSRHCLLKSLEYKGFFQLILSSAHS